MATGVMNLLRRPLQVACCDHLLVVLLAACFLAISQACNDGSTELCPVEMTGQNKHTRTYCGTSQPSNEAIRRMGDAVLRLREDRARKRRERRLDDEFFATIPVYFHLMKRDEEFPVMTDDNIDEYMDILNAGFEGTGFEFKLEEVEEIVDSKEYECGSVVDSKGNPLVNLFKRALRRGGRSTLNVFFCNLEIDGQSTFPPDADRESVGLALDGVLMAYPGARLSAEETQWTLVHEVGHWLGLLHTFQDGCKRDMQFKTFTEISWLFHGDGVSDTGAHAGPTWDDQSEDSSGQKLYELCYKGHDVPNTCSDTANSDVDPGRDPVNNYMNYIHYTCMRDYGEFTDDQIERMQAQYTEFRTKQVKISDRTIKKCKELIEKDKNCGECNGVMAKKCARGFMKCKLSGDENAALIENNQAVADYVMTCPMRGRRW